MKKLSPFVSLFALICLSFSTLAFGGEISLSETEPHYINARYGFAFILPPGKYSAVESENNDGVTIKDGKGFTLLAYGTRSYHVLEKSFHDAIKEVEKEFTQVSDKKVDTSKKTFEITGLKGANLIHVKCFFKDGHANVLRITHGQSAHDQYKELCTSALTTFR